MKIYYIALAVIIMSASLQIVNDMQIFSHHMNTQTFDSAQGKVTVMTNTTSLTDLSSDFLGVGGIVKAIGYIFNAMGTAIVIIPLLSSYGVPLAISAPIQGIIWFVYGMGAFQIISGRGVKYFE